MATTQNIEKIKDNLIKKINDLERKDRIAVLELFVDQLPIEKIHQHADGIRINLDILDEHCISLIEEANILLNFKLNTHE
jgi:hypothetical protein